MSASTRKFTQLAVQLCYGDEGTAALERGDCPACRQPIGKFRDALSRKEFGISGMCQECQDKVFA